MPANAVEVVLITLILFFVSMLTINLFNINASVKFINENLIDLHKNTFLLCYSISSNYEDSSFLCTISENLNPLIISRGNTVELGELNDVRIILLDKSVRGFGGQKILFFWENSTIQIT